MSYELMVGARGPEGIAAVERSLEGLREIPVDRSVQRAVLPATGSHGARRLPLTDLATSVRFGKHLGVESHWISDPRDGAR